MTVVDHKTHLTVGAILSSSELLDKVHRLAKGEFNKVHTELVFGLDEAIPVGKSLADKGADVIIGRSCIAELLRENLPIPVIPIKVNPLDILTSIKMAMNFGKRILITTFRTPLQSMEILEEIFNVKIIQGIYYDSASLEQVIVGAKAQGVSVVIGGGVSIRYAKKYELPTVALHISDEAVAFAVADALSLAKFSRQEQEKSKRYQCIIDATSDAIVSSDRFGVLTTMNKAAKTLFNIDENSSATYELSEYLPKSNFRKIFETKQQIG
ncbi:MAG: PrpR N-terminal domain-containing protein, partial [Deltaproteobacteria bacterium]|nr:PrpR N-terminal domain-containing protein [Deltaproteobacteria bacterium]